MKQAQNTSLPETIHTLRQDGFTIVFRLENDKLVCPVGTFTLEDFDIVRVYPCRDGTDQTREATVYAIRAGLNGLLIMGNHSPASPIAHRIQAKVDCLPKPSIHASLTKLYLTCKQILSLVKLPTRY
ncbi:hypothetical protein BH09BAC4_BH09BAC4_24240 [soil metagenome]